MILEEVIEKLVGFRNMGSPCTKRGIKRNDRISKTHFSISSVLPSISNMSIIFINYNPISLGPKREQLKIGFLLKLTD